MSYAKELSEITGYAMATGFGLTTHYYNTKHGLIPEEAVSFCTIPDYVAFFNCTGESAVTPSEYGSKSWSL